jgi:hypothetical protein
VAIALSPAAQLWFNVERTLTIAFLVLFGIHLVLLARQRQAVPSLRILLPVVPLLALGALWSAALVDASPQLAGLGTPLAVLAGALALGAALTGLSLGHWYLVSPTLSVKPLILVTFLCLGAVLAQTALAAILLLTAPDDQRTLLFTDYAVFLGVRVIFGLAVPIIAAVMTWRTARIRSLDSATGLLYIIAALILAGEIAARTLYFLTGVST